MDWVAETQICCLTVLEVRQVWLLLRAVRENLLHAPSWLLVDYCKFLLFLGSYTQHPALYLHVPVTFFQCACVCLCVQICPFYKDIVILDQGPS